MFKKYRHSFGPAKIAGVLLLQLLAFYSFSQDNVLRTVQNKVAAYHKSVWQEKMYVHTDKAFYLAGEIAWFKIYLVEAISHRPAPLSKTGYVEILDKDNKPVAQAKIALKEGEGKGSFHLPLAVSSGYYKLRAYTNWMKNSGPDLFFEKIITIVNPLKSLPSSTTEERLTYSVDFFPEGGNLAEGIGSKIAFKIYDQYGRGVQARGVVVNENDDTVAAFQPLKFGIGSFRFLPERGHVYKAIVQVPGGAAISRPLPVAAAGNYAMNVEEMDPGSLTVRVGAINRKNVPVFLVVQAGDAISFARTAVLQEDGAVFSIDKKNLAEGVNRFTVFNSEGRPVCNRLYFKRPAETNRIQAAVDRPSYASRQKVKLSFKVKEEDTAMLPAALSLAVYRVDRLQTFNEAEMAAYLWLSSELEGFIEAPSYYLTAGDSEAEQAADNLMLTQRNSRFKWETVLSDSSRPPEFPLEYYGQLITAKMINTHTGEPGKDMAAFLSIPGSTLKLFAAKSDSLGMLQFDVRDYYGRGELLAQTGVEDSVHRVSILNPFSEKYSTRPLPPFSLSVAGMDSLLEDYSIGMQVQNVYEADKIDQYLLPPLKDTFPFYGRPSTSYALDDYKRFTTMEEVLREYVREINVGVRGGKLFMKLFNADQKDFSEDNILLLVNGIPLRNINKIFSYDPLKFKTLDIIPHSYVLGPSNFVGLVSLSTYSGGLDDLALESHLMALDYEGLQLQREFYAPVYETVEQGLNRTPDFRNTLFWKYEVPVTGKTTEVEFFTCDQKGKYIVIWQGIDAEGKITEGHLSFDAGN